MKHRLIQLETLESFLVAALLRTGATFVPAQDHPNVVWTGANPGTALPVAFAPDGRTLATGCEESNPATGERQSKIRLWRVTEGGLSHELTLERKAMTLSFSPDGAWLAAGSYDGGFEVWRLADGKRVLNKSKGDVTGVAFAPEGALATWCSDESTVELWQVPEGALLRTFAGRSWSHHGVSFSPDGRVLAAGNAEAENEVRLWRVADATILRELAGHATQVRCTACSHDSSLLVSGADDGTARVWRVQDGALVRTLTGHTAGVWSLAIARDGTLASSDGSSLRLWRLSDGALLRNYSEMVSDNVAFSPNGQFLAYGRDGTVVLARNPFALPCPNPDTRPTCAGSLDTSFDAGSGVRTAQGYADEAELDRLLLEPSGDVLIYGSFWLAQGQPRRGLARLRPNGALDPDFAPEIHGTVVRAVARQPDGRLLIAGDFTAVETNWRPQIARLEADGALDWSFYPDSGVNFGEIHALAVQPDGRIIVAGSGMATWQATNLVVLRLEPHGALDQSFAVTNGFLGRVQAIALQSDGKILLGGVSSVVIQGPHTMLTRLNADGTPDATFTPALYPDGGVSTLALQPDNRILVGGVLRETSYGKALGLVRLEANGSRDQTFQSEVRLCNDCDVRTLARDPQGRVLIGGRFDRLNNTQQTLVARVNPDGTLDATFQASMYKYPETGEGEFVSGLALQPDGRLLIAGYLTRINGHEVRSAARLFTTCCDCPSIVSLTAPGYWVDEAEGAVEIDVARTGNLAHSAAVDYVVSPYPFQPPGSATPGAEFAAPAGTVTFGSGQSNQVLRVPIFNDQMAEASERFQVTLHSPAGDTTLGRITETTVVIVDDETAGSPGGVDRAFHLNVAIDDSGIGVLQLVRLPDGGVLMAGAITQLNGAERHGLARLSADGSLDQEFTPVIDGRIRAVAFLANQQILIGGDFTQVNGTERNHLARLNPNGSLDAGFAPRFNGEVLALAEQPDGRLLVGGQFTLVNGNVPRNGLVRLDGGGGVDAGFDVGSGPRFADGFGYVNNLLLLPGSKVLVGGVFSQFNGVMRRHLARLDDTGAVDTGFDPEATRTGSGLYAMALQPDGKILLAGHFSIGTERGLIRLHPQGALDESFATEQSYFYVSALALQPDGCILIGGSFRVPEGGSRGGVARLRPDGSLERHFFVGEGAGDGFVNAMLVLPSGQILAGGWFSSFNALPYANLVRLNGNPGGIAPFVVRDITGFNVRLLASPPPNISSYTVEDAPPFSPAGQVSEGGVFDPETGRVRFGPFTDQQQRTLSYVIVLPPGDCLRPGNINGLVQADEFQIPVVGETVIGVDEVFPADLGSTDGRVSHIEAEGYAAAWRHGHTWPEGPLPIPIDYATRALTLALGEDAYWFDAHTLDNHPALRWLNFGAEFPQCVRLPEPLPTGVTARQAPTVFVPGVPFTVTIQVTPADHVNSYAVGEQVPWDWQPRANHDGVYDGWSNQLKWGPFADHTPRTFTYELTPPNDPGAIQCGFAGAACFDGVTIPIADSGAAHAACQLEAVFDAQIERVQLALEGVPQTDYIIESSNDLTNWDERFVVHSASGRVEFFDPAAPAEGHRFYRAKAAR